ncbi:unnamed protein product [Paramecium sonneborni]|uniref:Tetratricopeptide repeat protein n=1 Tax=Paramecium sonneborni TaxID=65129 RepID=A0A8S1KMY4_9CILI|nr:unnamed protein product [Paramecium sonneborni]
MFLSNQLSLKCQTHNKPINSICINVKCEQKTKIICVDCRNENIHFGCKINDLSEIHQFVDNHSVSFKKAFSIVSDLEQWFLGMTKNLKQVLEGYQVSDIFQFISESQDLNQLATILHQLPILTEKIQEISQLTRKVLENYFLQSTESLLKYQQNDLNKTIVQRPGYNNLLLTQKLKKQDLQSIALQQKDLTIDELFENGKQQLQENNFKKAIDYFEQIHQKDPQNTIALELLGIALKKLDYQNSALQISQTIQENPLDKILLKGQVLYKQKQYSQAIEQIKKDIKDLSIEIEQKQLEKLNFLLCNNQNNLSQMLFKEQLIFRCIRYIQVTYKRSENNLEGICFIAKFNVKNGKLKEVEQYLQNMSKPNEDDFGNKKIQSIPQIILVQLNYEKGEYQNCLKLINEQLKKKIKIKDQENLKNLKKNCLVKLNYEQSKYDEAMACWLNFFYKKEDDSDNNYIIGLCLSENKMYSSAIQIYNKILIKNSNHTEAKTKKQYAEEQIKQLSADLTQSQQVSVQQSASLKNFRINKPIASSQICFSARFNTETFSETNNSKLSQIQCSQIDPLFLVKLLVDYNHIEVSKFIDKIIQSAPKDIQLLLLEAKFYIKNINYFSYQEQQKVQKKVCKSLHYLMSQTWNNTQNKIYQEARNLQIQFDQITNQIRPQTANCIFPNINEKYFK